MKVYDKVFWFSFNNEGDFFEETIIKLRFEGRVVVNYIERGIGKRVFSRGIDICRVL